MSSRRLAILIIVLAAAGLLVWLWRPARPTGSVPPDALGGPAGSAAHPGSSSLPPDPSNPSASDPNAPLPGSLGAKPMDPRAAHQALVARIRDAITRRKAELQRQKSSPSETEAPDPELTQEDFQAAIHGALPALTSCYQAALTRNPGMGGKLNIHFTVIADPEVGGIVESAEADDTQLREKDEQLVKCMNDAIYDLEKLPNPKGSGEIEVVMPIVLQAEGPER